MDDTFQNREYGPELVEMMGNALDHAWRKFEANAMDAELARLVMASAILDKVDAGNREHDELVSAAISALTAASRLSGAELGGLELNWRLRK